MTSIRRLLSPVFLVLVLTTIAVDLYVSGGRGRPLFRLSDTVTRQALPESTQVSSVNMAEAPAPRLPMLFKADRATEADKSSGATVTDIRTSDQHSFPVVGLSDNVIANRINAHLRTIYGLADADFTSPLALREMLTAGRDEISYRVLLNTPTLLSISIASGSGRAWGETAYHFSLYSGRSIAMDQVVMPSKLNDLRQLVCDESKKRLVAVKNKVTKDIENGDHGWVTNSNLWYSKGSDGKSFEDYWLEEMGKQCTSIQLEKHFGLSKDGISFYYVTGVGLPMSARAEEPAPEYFYPWAVAKTFLIPFSPISDLVK